MHSFLIITGINSIHTFSFFKVLTIVTYLICFAHIFIHCMFLLIQIFLFSVKHPHFPVVGWINNIWSYLNNRWVTSVVKYQPSRLWPFPVNSWCFIVHSETDSSVISASYLSHRMWDDEHEHEHTCCGPLNHAHIPARTRKWLHLDLSKPKKKKRKPLCRNLVLLVVLVEETRGLYLILVSYLVSFLFFHLPHLNVDVVFRLVRHVGSPSGSFVVSVLLGF